MPIYEYSCSRCGRQFEKYVATPAAAVACPACGHAKVTRRLSLVGVKTGGAVMSAPAPGGCCGGGCGCH